jgi:DNA-binding CsgD family transcriptional regulator
MVGYRLSSPPTKPGVRLLALVGIAKAKGVALSHPVQPDVETVIGGLYEAAATPALWPQALSALAALTGSRDALITRPDRRHDGLAYSPGLTDTVAQFFEQGWHQHDLRTTRMVARANGRVGFLRDQDIASADEWERSDYYRGFARSAGVPWFAACGFVGACGQMLGVSIQRSQTQGPFEEADLGRMRALEPHLWAMLRFSLQSAEARDGERLRGLERLDVAALLLDRSGRVCGLNRQAEVLLPTVARVHGGVMVAFDVQARARFSQLIATACALAAGRGGEALKPVRLTPLDASCEPEGAILAEAMPLFGAARDLFGEGQAILTLSPIARAQPPDQVNLQVAFGLTPAEAQVAHALCAGLDVPAIAKRLGVTAGAVRFHLKAILPKAGVKRQAAFVAAAASLRRASLS